MSINKNWLSATLSSEEVEAAVAGLKGIEAALPFVVTLKKDERMAVPKVGAKSMEFSKKAYQYADKNPELVPGFVDMVEFKSDLELAEGLETILNHLVPLVAKLQDSVALAKADSYQNARHVYHHSKASANAGVPGGSAVADELGKLYKNRGSSGSSGKSGEDETPVVPSEPVTERQAA